MFCLVCLNKLELNVDVKHKNIYIKTEYVCIELYKYSSFS